MQGVESLEINQLATLPANMLSVLNVKYECETRDNIKSAHHTTVLSLEDLPNYRGFDVIF